MSEGNFLTNSWNSDQRCYEPGEGEIPLNGEDWQVRISNLELPAEACGRYPTNKRAVVQVGRNIDSSDTALPTAVGWGGCGAQSDGSLLEETVNAMGIVGGYDNAQIIGINTSGRGTPEYMAGRRHISKFGPNAEVEDARMLIRKMAELQVINPGSKVIPIGHSMGAQQAIAIAEEMKAAGMDVDRIIMMMPALERVFGLDIVMSTIRQLWAGFWQGVSGLSNIALSERDHFRIMGVKDRAHWERSVPDSARKFVGETLSFRRRFDKFLSEAELDVHIMSGLGDRVISGRVTENTYQYLSSKQGLNVQSLFVAQDFNHGLSFKMTEAQRSQISVFLRDALNQNS